MKEKTFYIISMIGTIICFIGDNLLGYFNPSSDFGSKLLFINFSYDWANVSSFRFVMAGLLGVISLLMMFFGFYGIYIRMEKKKSKFSKYFIFGSFLFVSVGILYHNVFAISAYIFNRLSNLGFSDPKAFTIEFFNTFIKVGFLAAVGYFILALCMFLSSLNEEIYSRKCMCIINPLFFMFVCIFLSRVLPQTAFVNGVFGLGQQSLGLFIVFLVLYKTVSD